MTYTKLFSDLQFTLAKNEEKLILVDGQTSYVTIQEVIETGALFEIKQSCDSTEFVDSITSVSSMHLSLLQVGLTYISSYSVPVLIEIVSPNFLYFKNTSSGSTSVTFSLRGNR
jgi:hypothetical protein